MSRLENKVAVVTGGASGIGAACCTALAQAGAKVVIADIQMDKAKSLQNSLRALGCQAEIFSCDVTAPAQWQALMAYTLEVFGRLDILVNNAGIAIVGTIEDLSLEDWNKTIAVNQTSVFLGTQQAIRVMKGSGGSIINISSIEGLVGNSLAVAYNAAKGAVRLLTKSAALHCGQQGYKIRINSVHPGFVKTPLVEQAFSELPGELAEQIVAAHPIGRIAEPEEIATTVVFLASEEASFMTGSELVVDGGYTAQ